MAVKGCEAIISRVYWRFRTPLQVLGHKCHILAAFLKWQNVFYSTGSARYADILYFNSFFTFTSGPWYVINSGVFGEMFHIRGVICHAVRHPDNPGSNPR